MYKYVALLLAGVMFSIALVTLVNVPANSAHASPLSELSLSSQADFSLASNPEEVPFKPPYEIVSAGTQHVCGIQSNGQLNCWGDNSQGQATPPAGEFMQVSAGAYHTCALQANGNVQCWGLNDDGQTNVPAGSFSAVSAGSYHTCAIQSNGQVVCWGRNTDGQSTPVAGTFLQVSAGERHTCGVQNSGEAVCWGDDSQGQSSAPVATFRQVSSGTDFTCGVQDNGNLLCWGLDTDGQASPPAGYFKQVEAGDTHACAIQGNGDMVCWGTDTQGQVTGIPAGEKFKQVTVGADFSCGVLGNGMAACWGADDAQQAQAPFGLVFGLPQVSSASYGDLHPFSGSSVCGVKSNGRLIWWNPYWNNGGGNSMAGTFLQVSTGVNDDRDDDYDLDYACAIRTDGSALCFADWNKVVPQPTAEDIFIQISANKGYACGIRQDGTLACWGDNTYNQVSPPVGLFKTVSAGTTHACAIDYSGQAFCWGNNSVGQASPPSGSLFSEISAGGSYTCGLMNTGELACWGANNYGQTNAPTGQFRQVSSGQEHIFAIRSNGTNVCWGNDYSDKYLGSRCATLSGPIVSLSAGELVTCFVKPNGSVDCYGPWLCTWIQDNGVCVDDMGVLSPPSFDVQPPYVRVEQSAQQADPSNNAELIFDAIFSESVRGFTSQDVSLSGSAGATTVTVTGSGATYHLAVSGMTSSGSVIVSINAGVAMDATGNLNYASISADNQVTFDAESPNTLITSAPPLVSNNPSPVFEFSSPNPSATFECQLDGEPFSACDSPKAYTDLTDGQHIFQVRASASGLTDPDPAIHTWTVDLVPPETNLLSQPDDPTNNSTTATFTFSSNETATYECLLDSASFAACVSPKSYHYFSSGPHTVQVRARDAAGNYDPSPVTYTWTVDVSKPNVLARERADPDPTSAASVNFTVTFSENVKNVDTSDFAPKTTTGLTGAFVISVSGSGAIYTVTVSTGSGNGKLGLDIPNLGAITDMAGNPLGGLSGGQTYTVQKMLTLVSTESQDGWMLESGENTNAGGFMDNASATMILGDDVGRRQYRSMLSFDTSALPDNAVIIKVTLKVRKQGITGGGNPINIFQGFMVDIRRGVFGDSALELTDWQLRANKTVGPLKPTASNGWYSIDLTGAKAYINKLATGGGLTQIRLRFKLDDNNNSIANYLSLYSGNAGAVSPPQLIMEYYVP